MRWRTLAAHCIETASPTRANMLELGVLVRRDHDDLHYALRVMTEPLSDEVHVLAMLERVVSTFPAHAEAEASVLARMLEDHRPSPALYFMVAQVTAAHLAQESALVELAGLRPASDAFRERARYLRHMMIHHAEHEGACLQPALPDHLPRESYHRLATSYAAERTRLLGARVATLRRVG